MRSATIPSEAEIIRSFDEYRKLVAAFFAGHYNLLIIVGRPGLSKSYMFEEQLDPSRAFLLRGHATPFKVYQDLWEHRHKLTILDDAEDIWRNKTGRVLLRSLSEHKSKKLVQWESASKQLEKLGIPTSFRTASKCAFICNKFVFGEAEEYGAIADRGHIIYFDPPPIEIHKEVGRWFWCQEIYDYIGGRLDLVKDLSARTYLKALERMRAGGDWRKLIDTVFCHSAAMRLVKELEGKSGKKMDKVRQFTKETGMSPATYYLYRAQLEKDNQLVSSPKPPKIRLTGKAPEDVDIDEEIRRAQEEAAADEADEGAGEQSEFR
jgi:hypothetical protein